mgnify:CR=1 FL=1
MKNIYYIIGLILITYSCETDFEINAPYDKVPIVYGILDQSVDTQFIKINKTFLGTNNLAYPAVNDSMYFDNVDVKVEELDDNEKVLRVFSLQSKYVPVAPGSGIFFTGQQKVYYFVPTSPLDETREYRIVGNGDGKKFSATTDIINSFGFANNFRIRTLAPGGVSLFNAGVYPEIKPIWIQSPDAQSYDAVMRFHYTEHRNGKIEQQHIDWKLGSAKPSTSGDLTLVSNAESFFILLANSAQLKDTAGVTKRVIDSVDFRVTSANFILKTYIDVSKPNSGITFDKPEYTNIEGGRGVFASRFTTEITGRLLSEKTVAHLFNGVYTTNFKFCSNNPAWGAEPYFCP